MSTAIFLSIPKSLAFFFSRRAISQVRKLNYYTLKNRKNYDYGFYHYVVVVVFFRQAVAQGEKVKAFQKMPVLSAAAPASEIFL